MSQFYSFFLSESLSLIPNYLIDLVHSPQGKNVLQMAFSTGFNIDEAIAWLKRGKNNYSNFPQVEIVASSDIDNEDSAYEANTNTIYLSAEFITQNKSDREVIKSVILKEYGHFLSAQFDKIAQTKQESERTSVASNNQPAPLQPATIGINPAFDLIGLTQLRNDPQFADIDGSGFSVVVIDSGLDREHPMLAPNYVAGFDFLDNDNNPNDTEGHGTHVAGIVGAMDENIGVAPGVDLIGLRVLDDTNGSVSKVEDALEWVYDNYEQYSITAVNLSLGLGFYTSVLEVQGDILSDDIQRLESVGITVVGAAGNNYFANSGASNQENLAFPGISSTLAVGAVWQDDSESNVNWQSGSIDYTTDADRIASFSQRSDTPNLLFAPGALITSTLSGGGTGGLAGTSQAAPHVAGAVALMQQASLEFSGDLLTPEEVREILISTGDPIVDGDDEDDNIINTEQSYVRINVYNAIAEIKTRGDDRVTPPDDDLNNEVSTDQNGIISSAQLIDLNSDLEPSVLAGMIGADYGETVATVDIDILKVVAPDDGILLIDVDTPFAENFVDSYVRLFDAEGDEILNSNQQPIYSDNDLAVNNNGAASEFVGVSDSAITWENPNQTKFRSGEFGANNNYQPGNYGHDTDSFIKMRIEQDRVYYVGISDSANQGYNPNDFNNRLEGEGGGRYELTTTFIKNENSNVI